MGSSVDDDGTLRANREGFAQFQLRARRLVNVREVDMSVTIFGERWETPIFVCPTGSQKIYDPEGDVATARAAKAKGHLMMLSGVTTSSVEEVNAARGMPVWFQCYPTDVDAVAHAIVGARRGRVPGAHPHGRPQRRAQPGDPGARGTSRQPRLR
ncbi:MAG: alpha-hydroxy-acid oxidizing protein [Gemmatimonadetes bacterium]|nr:alpha-hydroxy-acid oxidizing protein [Gemmatimonadota bacterium]